MGRKNRSRREKICRAWVQKPGECGILLESVRTDKGAMGVERLTEEVKGALRGCAAFLKWAVLAGLTGVLAAVAFHWCIGTAGALRTMKPWLVWLLPVCGAFIAWLYKICGMEKDRGTNLVLVAVREGKPMRLRTAPLIFLSTVLTHLAGGSAGREGAALQMGGSLGDFAGQKLRLDDKDRRILVMCGMAAAFSALFGTPITAAVFAIEVESVGVMYYAALVPCLVSSVSGFLLARALGLHGLVGYAAGQAAELGAASMLQTVALGALCALVSVVFCEAMHLSHRLFARYIPDARLRGAVGGAMVLALIYLLDGWQYCGAGDELVRQFLGGKTIPWAFLLKILFTALTLGSGFRGGEIVPVLCTGCAFGTWMGPLLGLPHGFSGALGMAAVFCGATNCPVSSILLSYELFGGQGMILFSLCCAVSYMLSGYFGLYSEQKIVYSKFRTEWIDKKAL